MNQKLVLASKMLVKKLHTRSLLIELGDKLLPNRSHHSELSREALLPKKVNWKFENTIHPLYDVQIIIPVYNAKDYIEECLQSVLMQETFFSYLVTIIDDGSTDGSNCLLDKYQKEDSVEVIYKSNGGAASARNAALMNIKGKYVLFLDADDKLSDSLALQHLMEIAVSKNIDIVEGGYETFGGTVFRQTHKYEEFCNGCGKLFGFPWGKVIKADLFLGVCFPEGFWYEDTIMSYLIHTRADRCITIPEIVLNYRANPSGFSHIKGNDDRLLDSYWVIKEVLSRMECMGIVMNQQIYNQLVKSVITACTREMYMTHDRRMWCMNRFSELLSLYGADMHSTDKYDAVFERAIRKNQYGKVKFFCLCFE